MEQGVALADPSRCDVRGNLACGRDVTIDVNCVFEGKVELGDRVLVGANCVLKDVTVAAVTAIEAPSHLQDAAIRADCPRRPSPRYHPVTRQTPAGAVNIRNFVDVDATRTR